MLYTKSLGLWDHLPEMQLIVKAYMDSKTYQFYE